MTIIVNGAPWVYSYGTQDLSTRVIPAEPSVRPTHLPKTFFYAQKGPTTPQLVVGGSLIQMYGADSFDPRKKYYNHATHFGTAMNAQGNAGMWQRVMPTDAGPEATATLWLDLLETEVDIYERNDDGSIKLDINGDKIKSGDKTPGFKAKWVVTNYATTAELQSKWGKETQKAGTQTDVATSTQSQLIPIIQFKASSFGAYYNNVGFRLWAPTTLDDGGVNEEVVAEYKTFPVRFSMIARSSSTSTAKVVESINGEQSVLVSFGDNVIDPNTDRDMSIKKSLIQSFQNLDDPKYPPVFGDIGDMVVYFDNIKAVQELVLEAEAGFIESWSDIKTDDADEAGLINIWGGVSTSNVPYHTFVLDTEGGASLSPFTNIYLKGGSDGTMGDDEFSELVIEQMAAYLEPNNDVQDLAYHVESIFYDSGYKLQAKYALLNAIALRRDTAVVLSIHVAGGEVLTVSEENSLAVALRAKARLFPESDYFGTPAARAIIIGRSAVTRSSQYTERASLSYELAVKAAKYMGAGNGKWKNNARFDGAPGSIIENMKDVSIPFTGLTIRNKDWDVGLNYALRYDRDSMFFPALKTVYDDDSSVLNSFITVMAICELNKIAHMAWREYSGISSLTSAQLHQRVKEFVLAKVEGVFDDRFIINPVPYNTTSDDARGYSWTLPIEIYAPNMKTVMTTYVKAYRIEDYKKT